MSNIKTKKIITTCIFLLSMGVGTHAKADSWCDIRRVGGSFVIYQDDHQVHSFPSVWDALKFLREMDEERVCNMPFMVPCKVLASQGTFSVIRGYGEEEEIFMEYDNLQAAVKLRNALSNARACDASGHVPLATPDNEFEGNPWEN